MLRNQDTPEKSVLQNSYVRFCHVDQLSWDGFEKCLGD